MAVGTVRKPMEGLVFGRLTVMRRESAPKVHHVKWLCKCTCGGEKSVTGEHLRDGHTRSCGCLVRETTRLVNERLDAVGGNRFRVHGHWASTEYRIWQGMKRRCLNSGCREYRHYGGRGIGVCARWVGGEGGLHPFECFLKDVGPRPSKGHSLNRVDNEGDYTPDNVQWATRKEQNWNRNQVASSYELRAARDRIAVLEARVAELEAGLR